MSRRKSQSTPRSTASPFPKFVETLFEYMRTMNLIKGLENSMSDPIAKNIRSVTAVDNFDTEDETMTLMLPEEAMEGAKNRLVVVLKKLRAEARLEENKKYLELEVDEFLNIIDSELEKHAH